MNLSITKCARCGNAHKVEFVPFAKEVMTDEAYTYWGMCPVTHEPIIMRVEIAAEGEALLGQPVPAGLDEGRPTMREFFADVIRVKESDTHWDTLWLCTREDIRRKALEKVDRMYAEWKERELRAEEKRRRIF